MKLCAKSDGVPSYEIKDSSSNVKVTHCNWLFLVATLQGEAMPLRAKVKMTHVSMSTRYALVELTPWECENDSPEDNMEGWLT